MRKLGFAGYFLIVWDIVRFCKSNDILIQGRGSAANSVVCYALEITAIDPVGMDLLFERFLNENRNEWPDVDLDLPSGDKREQAIQYVYQRYGELGAAMTANVITYRGKSAAREVGKALGFDEETLGRLSGLIGHWEWRKKDETLGDNFRHAGFDLGHWRIAKYVELCERMQDLPRHLGQHSGGMVICQGQLNKVVPLERASMPGRSVVQWDKEDCADLGLVKIDLLGLGMMAVMKDCLDLIPRHYGDTVDLAQLPEDDPEVYAVLRRADTVGMFQVESRAQMASIPRNAPTKFYDLVVQVAIIRPGPIVGKMMHPYMRRRQGREAVTYPVPSLEPVLKRTLGVPLFQEQLLRIAMVVGNFTGAEAEELRKAVGMRRSWKRMEELMVKLRKGMGENSIAQRNAGSHRPEHPVVRPLWLSRVSRRQLCAHRLRFGLLQGEVSRRLHLRHAQQPAHGLLHALPCWSRTPSATAFGFVLWMFRSRTSTALSSMKRSIAFRSASASTTPAL